MDFNSTKKGSLLENFFPKGWDFEKIQKCCAHKPEDIFEKQPFCLKNNTQLGPEMFVLQNTKSTCLIFQVLIFSLRLRLGEFLILQLCLTNRSLKGMPGLHECPMQKSGSPRIAREPMIIRRALLTRNGGGPSLYTSVCLK